MVSILKMQNFQSLISTATILGWDPSKKSTSVTLSGGNLVASCAGNWHNVLSVTGVSSGKRYGEVVITTLPAGQQTNTGFATSATSLDAQLGQNDNYAWVVREFGAFYYDTGSGGTDYGVFVQGDVVGLAYDADTGKMWIAFNNTWLTGSPSAGTTPIRTITANTLLYIAGGLGPTTLTIQANTTALTYSPPSGFSAWNT